MIKAPLNRRSPKIPEQIRKTKEGNTTLKGISVFVYSQFGLALKSPSLTVEKLIIIMDSRNDGSPLD